MNQSITEPQYNTPPAIQNLPLATLTGFDFKQLRPEVLASRTQDALAHAQHALDAFSIQQEQWTAAQIFDLLKQLEYAENALQQIWRVFSNLNNITSGEEIRHQHQILLKQLSAFYTQYGQQLGLYHAHLSLQQSSLFQQLSPADQSATTLAIRNFQLTGVNLPAEKKQRLADINARLSALSSQFSDHVLDASQSWYLILSEEQLSGLPENTVQLLKQLAQQRITKHAEIDENSAIATLDMPIYNAIVTYAEDRQLRENLYTALFTVASELGDTEYDNTPVMEEILQLRHEKAQLLGFENFAELSLASKMAPSVDAVKAFLNDLAVKARPAAEKDLIELQQMGQHYGIEQIKPWDVPFLAEKIKQHKFNLSEEALKPYFPAPTVIAGLFKIAERLYGIQIEQKQNSSWHPQVNYYEISEQGQMIGGFYLDLYARPHKKGGAWETAIRSRMQTREGLQRPIVLMIANFSPPVADQPALLTHAEINVLFHEFGHGLHDLLTQVDNLNVAGTQSVQWDAIELPSQIMEFWTWDQQALELFSRHIETDEILPDHLLQALLNSRYFQTGLQTLRQIEFALFDIELYSQPVPPNAQKIQQIMDDVRQRIALIIPPEFNRFQHGFNHIFSGGYAAGYYSYKWAEVLASDAFDRFEQHGIFNPAIGQAFRSNILAVGASVDALTAFKNFRGREPKIDAMIRHNGW
ncbi:M3 family metallopeptidase [Acinetobacter puyangensis]|uniref:oligopeptidase A n=1 Tax=Acinetobacter puyangensis TaxID=1096779 RepID=A0A240EB42_9GAMM|nr:M3 family metallopeptidase [Acinetobacter puyangensis]SNX45928.1 oligopeptidase A Metallo peptidase. MEROPS family M03A [Acinetobacter puyangensis]